LSRDKSAAGVAQAAPVRSPIRSMTGFARASIAVRAGLAATVTLKSVNHRFLDIQVRLPGGLEALEPLLREAVKKNVLRGHVDVIVQVERDTRTGLQFNADAVRGYLAAFRQAAEQAGMSDQPDLNSIFRLPGVVSSDIAISEDDLANLQAAIGEHGPRLLAELNAMRALEGAALVAELRKNMQQLDEVAAEAVALREVSRAARFEEEIVRLRTHVAQFLQILAAGGECGKKLDFLLQEMNREANTLLSKTSGVAGNALRVTEIGLAMKSAIEKSREQIQNLE
jgi:uncharacterized protein YicC (UPF0701 family)